jgi:4'-phosphopantetheinyl transferase EntD
VRRSELSADDARRGLPRPVGVGIRRGADSGRPALFALEESCLGPGAGERRRFFFGLGRAAAREALAELGIAPVAIGSGPGGEPLWPTGIVGAISHTGDLAIAIVGRAADYAGLGVDVERLTPGLSARAAKLVCTLSELAWAAADADSNERRTCNAAGNERLARDAAGNERLARDAAGNERPTWDAAENERRTWDAASGERRVWDAARDEPRTWGVASRERPTGNAAGDEPRSGDVAGDECRAWGAAGNERRTMIFSAKEAVFKATYPIERVWLGFSDAELAWDARRCAFEARLLKQPGEFLPVGSILQVHCRLTTTQVLSTTYVPAVADAR